MCENSDERQLLQVEQTQGLEVESHQLMRKLSLALFQLDWRLFQREYSKIDLI
jgi:hypothetical protein